MKAHKRSELTPKQRPKVKILLKVGNIKLIKMFKFKMIIAVMLIMGVTAFVGCEKETVIESKSVVEKEAFIGKKTVLSKETKMEYFNSLGKQHNEVLDYIGKNIDVSVATQEERFDLASDYLNDNSTTFAEFLEESQVVDEFLNNPSATATLLFTNEDVPCEFSEYYNSLGAIFAYCLQKAEDNIEITPVEFNAMILELENSVYVNYSVEIDINNNTGDEASLFLGARAIARYSYQFWNNAIHDEGNPWNKFFGAEQLKVSDFWKKVGHAIKVGAWDTGGFLLGGLGIGDVLGDWKLTFSGTKAVALAGKWSASAK